MAIWRLVLEGKGFKERYPEAKVYDAATNELIGSAHSYTYGGTAWALHTGPFAGYVPFSTPSIVYGAVEDGDTGHQACDGQGCRGCMEIK